MLSVGFISLRPSRFLDHFGSLINSFILLSAVEKSLSVRPFNVHYALRVVLIRNRNGYHEGVFKAETPTAEKMGRSSGYCEQDVCPSHNWTPSWQTLLSESSSAVLRG